MTEETMTTKTMTLDDLIQKGVAIRNAQLEAEQKLRTEKEAKLARERAEAEQAIIAMFPSPLHEFTAVEFPSESTTYARVQIKLPSGGKVGACVERKGEGWTFYADDVYYYERGLPVYESFDPLGYYRRFFTLEEAIAYAMGAIS